VTQQTFDLMTRKCGQCLLSPNRIVSGQRMREILETCEQSNTHFICHKGSEVGRNIACRGHHDLIGGSLAFRLGSVMGIVRHIDPDTLQPVEKDPAV
jgi:hypothetical protein